MAKKTKASGTPAKPKAAPAKTAAAPRQPTTKKVVDAIEKALKHAQKHQSKKAAPSKKLAKSIKDLEKLHAKARAMCDTGFFLPE